MFAGVYHKDGIWLIAADSIIGFLRHVEESHSDAPWHEVVEAIERLID